MSVAASLARIRAATPVAPSRQQAAPLPRRDLAGLAVNGLDTLSTIDPLLPSLAPSLLLLPPYADRETLPPDEALVVSSAVAQLAARLAPVFPLRPAQKVVEWLLHGLRLSDLGKEAEVDAVMLSALPFHATPQFVQLAADVSRSRKWKKWQWLEPVAKQNKPPALHFVVRDCPDIVLGLAIDAAVEAVKAGVNVVAGASFLANVLVRRLSTQNSSGRRVLILAVVAALEKAHGIKVKGQLNQDLLCALMSAIAATVPVGLEPDVATAAAQTVAKVVRTSEVKSAASDTAAACLALLVTRAGVSVLGTDVARGLVGSGVLNEVLSRLGDQELAKATYAVVVLSLVKVTNPSVRMLSFVDKAFANENAMLLSDESVGKVLIRLFGVFSQRRDDGDKTTENQGEAMSINFVSLLSSLARGRFAGGVDLALREHLGGRKKNKRSQSARYSTVDDVINKALTGTAFEVVKETADKRQLPNGGTVLTLLTHPEPSVRKASLAKLVHAGYGWDEQGDDATKKIMETCLGLLKHDSDARIAADAAMCILQAPGDHALEDLLRSTLVRFRESYSLLSRKKKKKQMKTSRLAGVVALASALLSVGERYWDRLTTQVEALFVGLILDGSLGEASLLGVEHEIMGRVKNLLCRNESQLGFSNMSGDCKLTESLNSALKAKIADASWDCGELVRALSEYEPIWALNALSVWITHLNDQVEEQRTGQAGHILKAIILLFEQYDTTRGRVLKLMVKAVKSLTTAVGSSTSLVSTLVQIWDLVVRGRDELLCQQMLREVHTCCGLDKVYAMLLRCVSISGESHDFLRLSSLRWYLALSEGDSSEDVHKEAILIVLSVLYGNNSKLRAEIRALSTARKSALGKRSRKLPLDVVYSSIENADKVSLSLSSELETKKKETNIEQLLKISLFRYRERHGFGSPLLFKDGLPGNQGDIVRHIVARITRTRCFVMDCLSLLRAVQGVKSFAEEDARSFFETFVNLLLKLQECNASTSLIAESVTRISLILMSFPSGLVSRKMVLTSVKAAKSCLEVMEREGSDESWHSADIQFALVSASAHIFSLCQAMNLDSEKRALMGYLLVFSTKSSPAGMLAAKALDGALGTNFEDLEPFLERLGRMQGSRSKKQSQPHTVVDIRLCGEGIGAVQTLKRGLRKNLLGSSPAKFNTDSVLRSLWTFVSAATWLNSADSSIAGAAEYELQTVLGFLALLYRCEIQKGNRDAHVNFDTLIGVVFYSPTAEKGPESAMIRAVRAESLELLEALAPIYGAELVTRLDTVLEAKVRDKSIGHPLRFIHRLAPVLLKSGFGFRRLCNLMARAVYKDVTDASTLEEDRHLVASCCKLMPDMEVALMECIEEISRHSREFTSGYFIAKECSSLLLTVDQHVTVDLAVIAEADDDLKVELALVYVSQAKFFAKLTEALGTTGIEPAVRVAFTRVLQSLWALNREDRDKTIAAVVEILPLPALSTCIVESLSKTDSVLPLRVLSTLSELLDDDIPLSASWRLEDHQAVELPPQGESPEGLFVANVGAALGKVVSECQKQNPGLERADIAQTSLMALTCIRKIANRMGSFAPEVLLKLSATPLQILDEPRTVSTISSADPDAIWCSYISEALSCVSSLIVLLGKHAVPFIPKAVGVCAAVLKAGFRGRSVEDGNASIRRNSLRIALNEAAMAMCSTVLNKSPKFLGRSVLTAIATLAVSGDVVEVESLFLDAARKAPPGVSVGVLTAMTGNLSEAAASLRGLDVLLKYAAVMTEVMSKTELKARKAQIVTAFLKCLEFGRVGRPSALEGDDDGVEHGRLTTDLHGERFGQKSSDRPKFLSQCQVVDESCAEAMKGLVLRLSESDFKIFFNSIIQWLNGGKLTKDYDSAGKVLQVPQTIARAVPVFRISLNLMRTLQSIFVPYFMQVLDQVLDVVSSNVPELSHWEARRSAAKRSEKQDNSKKRNRLDWEGDEMASAQRVMVSLHREMYDVALENLVVFLNQDLPSSIMTTAVVFKIQSSLVSACRNEGKSDKVRNAFSGFGTRIIAVGNMQESKEESRQLLIALSRAILSLAGEPEATLREASVYYCKSLASTIGEEYLVTLPEAMPVLSELIDDESDAVRRETRAFVKVMESLSGESILEEMKS